MTLKICRKEIKYEVPLFDEIYFCFPLYKGIVPLFGTYTLIYQEVHHYIIGSLFFVDFLLSLFCFINLCILILLLPMIIIFSLFKFFVDLRVLQQLETVTFQIWVNINNKHST